MTASEQINRQRSHDAFLARKAEFDRLLADLQRMSEDHFGADPEAVVWDHAGTLGFYNDGKVAGASGIASPVFGRHGEVLGAVSVAGPSERIAAERRRLEPLVKAAGEQISRLCGFGEAYPPPR